MQDYDVELVVEEARRSGYADGYDVGHQEGWMEGYAAACVDEWQPAQVERPVPPKRALGDYIDRVLSWLARALDFGMLEWR